jgi:hypothetical protein
MAAASAATGTRTWLQTHNFRWLTPARLRALTIAVMSAAAIVSTIGFSGSTPAATRSASAHPQTTPARHVLPVR